MPVDDLLGVLGGTIPRQTEYLEAKLTQGKTGSEWGIVIIGPVTPADLVTVGGVEHVRSQNGRLYEVDGIKASTRQWDGIKVYDNHLTDEEFEERAGMRSFLGEGVGILKDPYFNEATRELCARLVIVDDEAARKLKNAYDKDVLEHIGLSVDTLTQEGKAVTHEGKRYPVVKAFEHILSLDIVSEPAAGGKFTRLLAAKQNQEVNMSGFTDEQLTTLRGVVTNVVAEALAVPAAEQDEMAAEGEVTPDDVAEVMMDEVEAIIAETDDPVQAAEEIAAVAAEVAEEVEEVVEQAPAAESAEVAELRESVRKLEAARAQDVLDRRLSEALDAAKLGPQRGIVEAAFKGRMWSKGDLMETIRRAKEAQAASDPTGQVRGAGGGVARLRPGLDGREVAELEFMRLIAGNTAFKQLEHIDNDIVRERMPESYRSWTRNGRPRYNTPKVSNWAWELLGGNPLTSERAAEAVTTTGMSTIVKNTVNILLAANYAKKHEWWAGLVTEEEVDTIDDTTLARVYGLSTLSVVNEGAAYTALQWADEEETASFVKRGNYIPVTIETLFKDKLNMIRSIPDRLATSWYNTLSERVSAVFTVNTNTGPVLSDTGALFNATATSVAGGHANLLTTALSYTSLDAAITAMMKQTDQTAGAGQRLLIGDQKFHLLIPVDLRGTAHQLKVSEHVPGSANYAPNQYREQFEYHIVPHWTDADDWAIMADPMQFPAIWLIFLRGNRVPSLFTADSETGGAMFTNDELRYKVRQMNFEFSSTYRCAPVSDFRPLHKSNV